MSDETVILERRGKIAWVTMNRPNTLNSLTPEMCEGLLSTFAKCEEDTETHVVVLCGTGKAFCAGGDLCTIASLPDREAAREYVRLAGRVSAAIINSVKPYIAAVAGAAAGAGFNIALACDFLCAAQSAKFTQAFSSIGLISDCGGNMLLPALVGPRTAKRLMMLPEKLSAREALALGIATELTEEEDPRAAAEALAGRLAVQPPLALARIKKMMNRGEEFERTLCEEEEIQSELLMSEDCREGVRAFFEKRAAEFKGR
ncbi:MAG: enoyl-CoA hydratase-related protein [Synergistaceae bacterium]|nr:enoyl-CoA hydratase-related protein [Synergistaceae bacterium]